MKDMEKLLRVSKKYRAAKGFGLFSIRERLQAIGGSVRIVSVSGEGATVAMSYPLKLRKGEFK